MSPLADTMAKMGRQLSGTSPDVAGPSFLDSKYLSSTMIGLSPVMAEERDECLLSLSPDQTSAQETEQGMTHEEVKLSGGGTGESSPSKESAHTSTPTNHAVGGSPRQGTHGSPPQGHTAALVMSSSLHPRAKPRSILQPQPQPVHPLLGRGKSQQQQQDAHQVVGGNTETPTLDNGAGSAGSADGWPVKGLAQASAKEAFSTLQSLELQEAYLEQVSTRCPDQQNISR